jgi:hypothetical protein
MNRRDKALLDKQLWGINPSPPSLIGLALVAMFLGGIIVGSALFAREKSHSYTASGATDGPISSTD